MIAIMWPRTEPRHAFSMVEVLVAMLVLASASVLVTSTLTSSSALVGTSKLNSDAATIANEQLDWYINYPETSSVPNGTGGQPNFKINSMPPVGTLKAVNIDAVLNSVNADIMLDSGAAPGSIGAPNGAKLSSTLTDFLYDKQLVLFAAQVQNSPEIRKYQCDIYKYPPPAGRTYGDLIYSASQLSGRLDRRSGN